MDANSENDLEFLATQLVDHAVREFMTDERLLSAEEIVELQGRMIESTLCIVSVALP